MKQVWMSFTHGYALSILFISFVPPPMYSFAHDRPVLGPVQERLFYKLKLKGESGCRNHKKATENLHWLFLSFSFWFFFSSFLCFSIKFKWICMLWIETQGCLTVAEGGSVVTHRIMERWAKMKQLKVRLESYCLRELAYCFSFFAVVHQDWKANKNFIICPSKYSFVIIWNSPSKVLVKPCKLNSI